MGYFERGKPPVTKLVSSADWSSFEKYGGLVCVQFVFVSIKSVLSMSYDEKMLLAVCTTTIRECSEAICYMTRP